jgi:hypothetical protein
VRPLGLGNGEFNNYVIYFFVIVSVMLLGVQVGIGTSNNCKDYATGWEGFARLLGFLGLWWRWGWWIGFIFYLGVIVLHWVGDLWNCWGICNISMWWRVCYLWSWQMVWMVSCGILVRLILCQMQCLIGLVSLWCKRRRIGWRVLLVVRVPLNGLVDFSGC